jgi:integrase
MSGSIKRDVERGTWYFVVDVASSDGKRRQLLRRGFPTKKKASEALAAVVDGQARGSFVRPARVPVKTFLLEEWLPTRSRAIKPSTAASYRMLIASYVVPRIGDVELGQVTGPMLNALYTDLLTAGRTGASGSDGGLSPKTVRNVHGMLHRAFKDAIKWQRLAVNPCDAADQPRKDDREMQCWTAEQLGDFIAATIDDRLGPVWHLFATTGLRRGEVAGLRWSDVDFAAKRLTVRQTIGMVGNRPAVGTPKTASGSRTVSLDDGTVAALRRLRTQQNGERLLMGAGWHDAGGLLATEADGTPIHPQVLSRRFTAAVKRAGLPAIRLHDVRHSYATAALGAGVSVKVLSRRLGHADIGVTLRTYAHVLPGDDEAAAAITAAVITAR